MEDLEDKIKALGASAMINQKCLLSSYENGWTRKAKTTYKRNRNEAIRKQLKLERQLKKSKKIGGMGKQQTEKGITEYDVGYHSGYIDGEKATLIKVGIALLCSIIFYVAFYLITL